MARILRRLLLVIFLLVFADKLGSKGIQIYPKQPESPDNKVDFEARSFRICDFMDYRKLVVFTQRALLPDFGQHHWLVDSKASLFCSPFAYRWVNILFWEVRKEIKTSKGKNRRRGY